MSFIRLWKNSFHIDLFVSTHSGDVWEILSVNCLCKLVSNIKKFEQTAAQCSLIKLLTHSVAPSRPVAVQSLGWGKVYTPFLYVQDIQFWLFFKYFQSHLLYLHCTIQSKPGKSITFCSISNSEILGAEVLKNKSYKDP